ncbi:MAG: tRNA lysidine(34) synthetase TilS [Candidatus Auribacterota bacterium]|nr:tRNA lysidine(34) synthetase TilS [Candidatus Auribacterota bacterium]
MNHGKTDSPRRDNSEKRLMRKMNEFVGRERLWQKGDRIMVAVSGGGDSVALLHLLHRLSSISDLKLTVVHLDHSLRGAASREDALWVRELAERLNIPCIAEKRDLTGKEKKAGLSPEESARDARYKIFGEVSKQTGITTIALGHQADDQAETVLLKLLRGCNPSGLGGMRPFRREGELRIIRPLLEFRRSELREYLDSIGESFREDLTNQDPRFLRNRVRLHLLPLLEDKYNPAIREGLIHLSGLERDRDDYLRNQLREVSSSVVSESGQGFEIDCERFIQLSGFEQGEVLRGVLIQVGVGSLHRRYIQALKRSVEGPSGRSLDLPGGIIAIRENDILRILTWPASGLSTGISLQSVPIPGEIIIKEIGAKITVRRFNQSGINNLKKPVDLKGYWESYPEGGGLKEYLDNDRVVGPLAVRSRLPGDRYRPLFMKGSRKIKDIFIDNRVPGSLRDSIPVILDEKGIIWPIGYRPAHRCRVRKETRAILEINLKPL